ncbi:type II toxin-antitoxin system Phd/YefM family antitoxin [Pelomicrobium sp. G1]|uniref:type II toxin-antitoxin system Phd/YefM family antitoxin n=1 Tax=unclassified Pelomicrobium TaxID=2815318 RepID=UPI0021DC4962|nr:MAG: antitoxin [Burkholderiales bacterium]
MTVVNVHQAKTHLSRLLEAVAAGEEVIIAKAGKPVARLAPIEKPSRKPGALKGTFVLTEGFFEPMPEDWLLELEEGHSSDPLRVKQKVRRKQKRR